MKSTRIPPPALAWLLAVLASAGACAAEEFVVTADRADGVYQVGQKITWQVEWKSPTTAPSTVTYSLKRGGLKEVGTGTLAMSDHAATIDGTLDAPGALLLQVKTTGSDGKEYHGVGGAVAQPDAVKPSSPRPDDFDAFWDSKIKELQAVPPNPQLQTADGGKPGVEYFKITMDNIRGTHIQGQLARPAQNSNQKLPAILIVQWAGVYGLEKGWVTDRAADGWLALNINPHDLPIDQPKEFYTQQLNGPLKNYWEIGCDDRDKSYFLRMYLSCYRAAEYLTQREDWDGKTLVVMGASQGGMQTLMTAAIFPQITAALADVPAGCDMLGPDVGRAPGFPQWYWKTEGRDAAKVRNASRYYDVVNFTPQIKCPVLVGLGLLDEVCPPEGVLAATNLIQSPKEIHIMPAAQHQEVNYSHAPFSKRCWEVWLPALRTGQAAPVQR